MNKSEQLIACLEGEIAKRDEELAACRVAVENCEVFRARIAELERQLNSDKLIKMVTELREELAAIKAQGLVMPEPDFYWVEADEGSWNSPEEWAQDYYDYNGEKPESVSFSCAIELPVREYDSFEFDANGSCVSCRLVNPEVARLKADPVQQVSVPDVSAMARILADRSADACNVNREDNWAIHGQDYIDDVTAMLAAAPAAQAANAGLLASAENCSFVMRQIASMDAEDIDGDDIDLRFEDAGGRDTGCDVSIVDYAEKTADVLDALIAAHRTQGVV